MRILMTTDTVGGVWTFTSELTEQLLQRGHAVHLVSFGRVPSSAQQAWADQHVTAAPPSSPARCHPERSEGPPYFARSTDSAPGEPARPDFSYIPTEIPLEWMQNNERAFGDGEALLLNEIRTFRPDIILSNQFCYGAINTTTPCVVVAHSDVLSWAEACRPSALEPTPWLSRYTSIVQSGLSGAAAVVAPTRWMAQAIQEGFRGPKNVHIIPNGVRLEPAADPAPHRKPQAITAGRFWDEAKGLDTLKNLDPSMPLLVAGDNRFETADQHAWPEHLYDLGPLSRADLHHRFRESDVYICASRYEPFGLAPVEAALCGCAVIARDIPSLREVWGDDALYFADTATLTAQLHRLTRDPAALAEAQHRSHSHAQQYTIEPMTDAYLAVFDFVLNQHRAVTHVA